LFTNGFAKVNYDGVNQQVIQSLVQPVKATTITRNKPNVVVFIVESYGREYIGAFNKMLIYPIIKVMSVYRFIGAAVV
jgi:hypothetical protein